MESSSTDNQAKAIKQVQGSASSTAELDDLLVTECKTIPLIDQNDCLIK